MYNVYQNWSVALAKELLTKASKPLGEWEVAAYDNRSRSPPSAKSQTKIQGRNSA